MLPPRFWKASPRPARYLSGWNWPWRGKRRHRPGIEGGQRGAGHHLHILQAGAVGGLEFLLEEVAGLAGRREEVAVDAEEVAVDPFFLSDRLDPVDGRGVALGGQPGPFLAVHLLDLDVSVVDGIREVGGGALGLPAGDGAVVQDDHALAFAGEQVSRGQSGDAGTDDADVRLHVLRQRLMPRDRCRLHPDRAGCFPDRIRHDSHSAAGCGRSTKPRGTRLAPRPGCRLE